MPRHSALIRRDACYSLSADIDLIALFDAWRHADAEAAMATAPRLMRALPERLKRCFSMFAITAFSSLFYAVLCRAR